MTYEVLFVERDVKHLLTHSFRVIVVQDGCDSVHF